MYEISVPVSTQVDGLIKIILHGNFAKTHARIIEKVFINMYPGLPFYIIITNSGKVDIHLSKHEKVGEVANALVEIVHI